MLKKKIDELIKEQGMTFGTLADNINVKRTTLLYHLSNPKIPLKYLIQIANCLKIPVSDLMVEEEVDIKGYIKYENDYYDLNYINDFVAFIDRLAIDCNLESDLYFEEKDTKSVK